MIDIRNTDKVNLEENTNNTPVIILTNYVKRFVIFKNEICSGIINRFIYPDVNCYLD